MRASVRNTATTQPEILSPFETYVFTHTIFFFESIQTQVSNRLLADDTWTKLVGASLWWCCTAVIEGEVLAKKGAEEMGEAGGGGRVPAARTYAHAIRRLGNVGCTSRWAVSVPLPTAVGLRFSGQ